MRLYLASLFRIPHDVSPLYVYGDLLDGRMFRFDNNKKSNPRENMIDHFHFTKKKLLLRTKKNNQLARTNICPCSIFFSPSIKRVL